MNRKYLFFFIIIFLGLVQCAKQTVSKPKENSFSIIYITDWKYQQVPKLASFIKTEQKKQPLLVIVNSEIFSNSPFSDLNKGLGDIELLNYCNVDAVFLNPALLKYGINSLKELIRKSNFSYLGANIKEKNTNQSLGQEFLFKTIENTRLAILGISYDSLDLYFQDKNLEFINTDFTILKWLFLINERSDFKFLLTQTQDTLDLPFTLVFGAPMKNQVSILPVNQKNIFKIDISYDNLYNINEIKRAIISLDTITPDFEAELIIKTYQTKADSILKLLSLTDNLNDKAIKLLLDATKTNGFLSDIPLISAVLLDQKTDVTILYDKLTEKNILPIITVKGTELQKYIKSLNLTISKISTKQEYSILTTTDFIKKHPELKYESIEFTDKPVWEILYNNLK